MNTKFKPIDLPKAEGDTTKFAKENGLTPHKFQIQCRVRKACELLRLGWNLNHAHANGMVLECSG